MRIETQHPTAMSPLVYECVEYEHRVSDADDHRATFACPRCRGVMKRRCRAVARVT
jgi:hypothetical protein